MAIILAALFSTCIIQIAHEGLQSLRERTDNESTIRYLSEVEEAVNQAVEAVNQTFVESLKAKGEFTAEAQKEALGRAVEAVRQMIPKDTYAYIEAAYDSVYELLTPMIEAAVKRAKNN